MFRTNLTGNDNVSRVLGDFGQWAQAQGLDYIQERALREAMDPANVTANSSFARFLGAIERGEAAYWDQGNQDFDTIIREPLGFRGSSAVPG